MSDGWGIADAYSTVDGTWHTTSPGTRAALREAIGELVPVDPVWLVAHGDAPDLNDPCHLTLEDGTDAGLVTRLAPDLPIGYHQLTPVHGGPRTFLVVHPPRLDPVARCWGVAVQLYSLRSAGSQGIGDLADLAVLLRWLRAESAGAVLVSPLHAPSPTLPQQDSPYFASSRLWWNPLHLRVPGLPDADGRSLVDRDHVWASKRSALLSWFVRSSMGEGWRRWVEQQGDSLLNYARWCALADHHGANWQLWPDELRHPDRPAVRRLDLDDVEVAFHAWCQWLVGRQLAEARRAAPDVHVIGDLAIGFDPYGADAWAFQDSLALGCRLGAPPDPFSETGQDWGIPPFVPNRLQAVHYRPVIDTVRAALRGVSGLRLDHVMGLFRQWWIPAERGPADGAYVRFPAQHLLAIVRVEAARAAGFIIGEDLGTVEDGVREAMAASGILGTRVAWFEDELPRHWPSECLATVTTHDLPTIAGVWQGRDGDAALRRRLERLSGMPGAALSSDVIVAAHEALARSPALLRMVTLEDLCATVDRPNIPGSNDGPNWRRRLPFTIEELARRPVVRASLEALRRS
jgi:4-alpha-glucanotransferase